MDGATLTLEIDQGQVICAGKWTVDSIGDIARNLPKLSLPDGQTLNFQMDAIASMDSAGAYLLLKFVKGLEKAKNVITFSGFHEMHQEIYDLVKKDVEEMKIPKRTNPKVMGVLEEIGVEAYEKYHTACDLLNFLGKTFYNFYLVLRKLKFPAWRGILVTIERSGYHSLPIIGLLLFLIGVVLSYQMGLQLKQYGANIYIVGLSGTAILREFGPLITAIIVAGKNASSFTAEIGTMQINEEIDALHTLGLSPTERLVLPKIFGVLIALPLLTIWANAFGVMGAMAMSKSLLHITYADYIARFKHDVSLRNYFIGLSKAPIFAIVIAGVGCFQGLQVEKNAESLGRKTTISVVQSIFLIIVIDAWFSMMFSWTEV